MPGLAKMIHERRQFYQEILDEVGIAGMTKLVEEGYRTGKYFSAPRDDDWSKKDRDERVELFWLPRKLTTKDGETPKIKQTYGPSRVLLPTGKQETYRDLKDRIEEEIGFIMSGVRQYSGPVNAYSVSELELDYVLKESFESVRPLFGDSTFLSREVSEVMVRRWGFQLGLYLIER